MITIKDFIDIHIDKAITIARRILITKIKIPINAGELSGEYSTIPLNIFSKGTYISKPTNQPCGTAYFATIIFGFKGMLLLLIMVLILILIALY